MEHMKHMKHPPLLKIILELLILFILYNVTYNEHLIRLYLIRCTLFVMADETAIHIV